MAASLIELSRKRISMAEVHALYRTNSDILISNSRITRKSIEIKIRKRITIGSFSVLAGWDKERIIAAFSCQFSCIAYNIKAYIQSSVRIYHIFRSI